MVVEEFQPKRTGQRSRQVVRAWDRDEDSGSTYDQEWRKILRRLCTSSTWTTALKMQIVVVKNAARSIACAWIPNAIYTFGNIFSGKNYTEQSRNELLVSNSVYAGISFCAVVFTSFLPMMMALRFRRGRPTIWFCFTRLVRATRVSFIVTMAFIFGFSSFIAYLNSIEPMLFTFKIECYADNLILLGYFTSITRSVKQIFYEETCEGRDRQLKQHKSKIYPTETTKSPHQPPFWKAYLESLPTTSASFLAGFFVHILSQQRIVDGGNGVLTGFVIIGILFKLAIQEIAKHYIFKKRVRSARAMCAIVGIPTVLVDTQTRIILLGSNNSTAVLGTLGMALVEVLLRTGKAVLVMLEIRHRNFTREPSRIQRRTVLQLFIRRSTPIISPEAPKTRRRATTTGLSEQELWRRQVHAFHTAEINADMYAEYISIGCSASILFFYGNHPHYWLLRQSSTAEMDVMAWRVGQLRLLGLQIGIEIIVDYVSFVPEMVIGIEFDHVKNLGSFLGGLFMIAAVMNITISIGYYLS